MKRLLPPRTRKSTPKDNGFVYDEESYDDESDADQYSSDYDSIKEDESESSSSSSSSVIVSDLYDKPESISRWKVEKGFPLKGWCSVMRTDLGRDDLEGDCYMCGKPDLKIQYTLQHPNYHTHIKVGSVCASHLCNAYNCTLVYKPVAIVPNHSRINWLDLQYWTPGKRVDVYTRVLNLQYFTIYREKYGQWTYEYKHALNDCIAGFYGSVDELLDHTYNIFEPIISASYLA